MTRRLAPLLLGLLLLGGCLSEINKPIRPGDPWLEKARSMDAVPAP